jgi:hypothetical protein
MMEILRQIPATAYAAIFGALVAFLGVYLTNRSNTQRLKIQLAHEKEMKEMNIRSERLEELYLLIETWVNALAMYHLPIFAVMRGELSYNDALDIVIENNKARPVDFKRILMLVDLYFPEMKPTLDKLSEARDKAAKILAEHKREYKRGNIDGSAFASPLLDAQRDIESASKIVKEQIINQVRAV